MQLFLKVTEKELFRMEQKKEWNRKIWRNRKKVAPHGFEPWSTGPGPMMIDRYTTGLFLSYYQAKRDSTGWLFPKLFAKGWAATLQG